MDQPTNDQDKTAQLLKAMTQVRIENAVRQMCANDMLADMAHRMTLNGMTITRRARLDALDRAGPSIGSAWVAARARIRPNFNMLAAIGYAVDEMMALPADALEPHTVH